MSLSLSVLDMAPFMSYRRVAWSVVITCRMSFEYRTPRSPGRAACGSVEAFAVPGFRLDRLGAVTFARTCCTCSLFRSNVALENSTTSLLFTSRYVSVDFPPRRISSSTTLGMRARNFLSSSSFRDLEDVILRTRCFMSEKIDPGDLVDDMVGGWEEGRRYLCTTAGGGCPVSSFRSFV